MKLFAFNPRQIGHSRASSIASELPARRCQMLQRACMNSQENFSELLRALQRDCEISRLARHSRGEIQHGSAGIKFRNSVLKGFGRDMGVRMGTDSGKAADSRTCRKAVRISPISAVLVRLPSCCGTDCRLGCTCSARPRGRGGTFRGIAKCRRHGFATQPCRGRERWQRPESTCHWIYGWVR